MPKSFLYIAEDRSDMNTDEKIKAVARMHLQRSGLFDNISDDDLSVAREERGKPYFPNLPWLYFSVSHSGDLFACAMSETPIGLDIQEHILRKNETEEDAMRRHIKIAERFFHPDERQYISNDPLRRFYKIWTAKESYVKLIGTGIDSSFSQFNIFDLGACLWQSEYEKYTFSLCCNEENAVEVIDLKRDLCYNI